MTFLLLHNNVIIGQTDSPVEALQHLSQPDNFLAETVVSGADPRTAIPGELDRAIDEWNAMTTRIKKKVPGAMHIRSIEKRTSYVKAYRTWRDKINSRPYLLESLPAAVEEQPFLWPTITFGTLFKFERETGEFRSDKIHARAYGKSGNGNGQITEAAYLALARTVRKWRDEHDWSHVGGGSEESDRRYEAAFEAGTGISWQRFEELRKRFNGGANV